MRIGWLDTMRVLASLIVIFSHYAYIAGKAPAVQHFFQTYIFNIGSIGVIVFFAVSGYLAANSLEHSKSILEFYRRKLIRIIVPFTVAYIFISVFLTLLGVFSPKISAFSPISKVMAPDGSGWAFVVGMLPLAADDNVTKFFQLPNYRMIGEWFIGTIVWLYLISPLVFKCLKKNLIISTGIIVAISLSLFKFGSLPSPLTFFMVRLPEFSFGMVLFILEDFINKNDKKVFTIMSVLGIILVAYGLIFGNPEKSIFARIILGTPLNLFQYIFAAAIISYFAYVLVKFLNEKFERSMEYFNSFSNVSYVAMLIHHFVIYRLNDLYHFTKLGKFGVVFFLIVTIFATVFLSEQIHKVYKPLEERLIKRRLFLE